MSAGKRILKFGEGGVLGAAVGTVVAILMAPRSGDELRGRVADRLRQARLAGAEAKVAKEDQLIRKFREDVEDPAALQDEETQARREAADAMAAIGLGLNAPGALAAQETAQRIATDTFDRDTAAVDDHLATTPSRSSDTSLSPRTS